MANAARLKSSQTDDVDRMIDALIADPSRAEDVKDMLRSKMSAPDSVRVLVAARRGGAAAVSAREDIDDMWDNVPV